MSRKIKFRIWDTKEKNFFNPDSLDTRTIHRHFRDILNDKNFVSEQFTGLKDKNGKEIYEGDIVKFAPFHSSIHGKAGFSYENGVVTSSKYGAWCIDGKNSYEKEMPFDNQFTRKESELEDEWVIGNIHENPELIK